MEDLHSEFPGPEERIMDFSGGQDMDLFNLFCAPNPTKVKIGTRPRAAYEVPLLTVTASRVIKMEDPAAAIESSEIPSIIERSPLDFANENLSQQSTGGDKTEEQGQETVAPEVSPPKKVTTTVVAPETGLVEEIAAMGPRVIKKCNKRGNDGVDANTPPKGATVAGDPESKNTSFTSMVGSPESIYQPDWGVTNGCRLDTPEACQDLVDHIAPPGYFSEMRHLHNDDFLSQYNINLAWLGEQKLKAAFKEFTKYEDDRVEKRCAKMDARLDALSIDFDEEGMSEGLKYGVEHGKANLDLEAIEAYDPEADTKYVASLHALRDLKYPKLDRVKSLKDALIDVIMSSLHLVSNSGEDAPQWIRELRPSSSQLKIHVYPEMCDLKDPCSFKEEILSNDAVAANVSHAEKKKKYRVVCRTHGVGLAHHARSDGVLVLVPTVAP
nr:hypothetical protein [Tanacetum cinerariifolium]